LHCQPLLTCIPCATLDLLLKHTDATYKRRQIKHLKQVYETFMETHEKHLKIIDLLLKYPDATVAAYKRRQMKHLK
jgi:hypothetical protein